VLSGFLITTLLLREEDGAGSINLRNFYARRSLRIFPLYYIVLGLYSLLVVLTERNTAAGRLFFENLPFYASYTNNWFVDLVINDDGQRRVIFIFAWTLATEEQFYLLWPSAMRFLKRSNAVALLLIVLLVDVLLEFAFGRADLPTSGIERLLRIATSPPTEILMGVLLALALHSPRAFMVVWGAIGRPWSAPLAGFATMAIAMWTAASAPTWYLAQSLVLTAFVGACVVREDHGLSWLLRNRLLARVGVVSYGMYLFHMLAVNAARRGLAGVGLEEPMLAFGVALLLTYACAELSFRFIESPILRLKVHFQADPAASIGR
jgi:peptidoglycan/LPS O-acetylase OafA/YrhL